MTKQSVRDYWEAQTCGTGAAVSEPLSAAYFSEIEERRYRLEPFIQGFADFPRWQNRRVLEVGVGAGTDFVNFARAGAILSGIDLTQAAVEHAEQRLAYESLSADLRVGDAEQLSFADASFDLVYSWGVLHHTPDTRRAIAEVRRVLAPHGEARIMLYSRHSWVALSTWVRHALLAGRPWRSFADVLNEHMESEGTKAYTAPELRDLFSAFTSVELTPFLTPYDISRGGRVATALGPRFGWFVGIRAQV